MPAKGCESFNMATTIPLIYRLFFLYIEPASALVGAYFAHFDQSSYLSLTHSSTATSLLSLTPASSQLPTGVSIIMSQLANLYLLFALNEALVLRSTTDLRVWKTAKSTASCTIQGVAFDGSILGTFKGDVALIS